MRDEEESYVRSYLTKDDDDWNFIDYISFDAVVGTCGIDTEDYGDYLMRIGDVVGTLLQSADARICEKGLWLHKYYLTAIETMRKASTAFRREYPGLCADVADLPKFMKLAVKLRFDSASPKAPRRSRKIPSRFRARTSWRTR